MASFQLHPGRSVGADNPCYVIAEIGQNHQGEMSIAMELISGAAKAAVDCVKFQKSKLTRKFTRSALDRPYVSKHSFGANYGEHKRSLEFTEEQFHQLQRYALNEGVQFTASPMDIESVDFLLSLNVPFLKIGSGDVNNYPMLQWATRKDHTQPIVLSTGMHDIKVIQKSMSIIADSTRSCCILQCTSCYPCPAEHVNLNVMKSYQKMFPFAVVGYSGHELSDEVSLAAVAMGAKVLERHVTLDHSMKGSDHACSLNMDQLTALVGKIRTIEKAFGSFEKKRCSVEEPCYRKLGKSIVTSKAIAKGEVIDESMLDIKVAEPQGIEAHFYYQIIGQKVAQDLEVDVAIQLNHLVDSGFAFQ
ncbi:sialic acid synthase-like isoform X2 [Tetranychus urticae]|nr:sialic acid synthase-like isoform X2 [Tetranychus urticae]